MSRATSSVAAMYGRWAEIEREYGQPLREVILDYRQDGNPWHVVAGALDCSYDALKDWRRKLGLEIDRRNKVYSDESWEGRRGQAHRRAERLGYRDVVDAIVTLRGQRLTWRQVALRLGMSLSTVYKYRPEALSWEWCVSPEDRRRRSLRAAEMNKRRGRQSLRHPWRQDESIRLATRHAGLPKTCETPEPGAR